MGVEIKVLNKVRKKERTLKGKKQGRVIATQGQEN